MGHCIHAIVAPTVSADAIASAWSELPRLNLSNGFALFPVDENLIDARIAADETPTATGDEFMLLTQGFCSFLQSLSRGGQLAYIETEYFGGKGGQGALVCRNGEEIMPPTWSTSGRINKALKLIGFKRGILADRFTSAGLSEVRNNDDILALIKAQETSKDANGNR